VRTPWRLRQLLALENQLADAADAAKRLGWTDMQSAIEEILEEAEQRSEREKDELKGNQ
jgi:hypothetical protein